MKGRSPGGSSIKASKRVRRFPSPRTQTSIPAIQSVVHSMSAVRTIVVGCGEPKKSMGWFHLQQLSVNPKAELLAVVEPWCATR
jgi:hypothetical protein